MVEEKSLENLQAWRHGVTFVKRVYKEVLPRLPKEEKWAMESQLRRAVQSIPAHIAEGYGRYYYQEGVRFCYIARGSSEECFSFLVVAFELEYIPKELFDALTKDLRELQRLINGYIAFLKKSKRGDGEPGANQALGETVAEYGIDPDMEEHAS